MNIVMIERSCGNCKYWDKGGQAAGSEGDDVTSYGWCRRYPPTQPAFIEDGDVQIGCHIATYDCYACGEFAFREFTTKDPEKKTAPAMESFAPERPLKTYNGMSIEEVNRKYLENTLRCPFCGSMEIITRGPMEGDGKDGWQKVECEDCKWSWHDIYKLTGLSSPEAP